MTDTCASSSFFICSNCFVDGSIFFSLCFDEFTHFISILYGIFLFFCVAILRTLLVFAYFFGFPVNGLLIMHFCPPIISKSFKSINLGLFHWIHPIVIVSPYSYTNTNERMSLSQKFAQISWTMSDYIPPCWTAKESLDDWRKREHYHFTFLQNETRVSKMSNLPCKWCQLRKYNQTLTDCESHYLYPKICRNPSIDHKTHYCSQYLHFHQNYQPNRTNLDTLLKI